MKKVVLMAAAVILWIVCLVLSTITSLFIFETIKATITGEWPFHVIVMVQSMLYPAVLAVVLGVIGVDLKDAARRQK